MKSSCLLIYASGFGSIAQPDFPGASLADLVRNRNRNRLSGIVRNFSQDVVVGDRWLLVRCHRMSCVTLLLRSLFLLLHVASSEGNRVDVFGELHLKNDHSSIAELHL